MHAEIIAVGSELTGGAKLDTNSQWLSLELAERGIPTRFHTTVADDLEAMTGVLRDAVNRSDLLLITGGLGPTLDDLTRQALAELVQRDLVLDEASLRHIESLFRRRNRDMPERNRIQAMFPAGSEPLANPRGTAPGVWMEVSRKGAAEPCRIAAMPGVPSEMKRMFAAEVLRRLPVGPAVIRRARVNCFGVGESTAEEMLGELTARGGDPEVGITVHEATITLRITAHGKTAAECDGKIRAAKDEIRARLGVLVFGEEDEELEHAVVRLLVERNLSLATAESGTGGLLAYRLSEANPPDGCFVGGVVSPHERDLLPADAAAETGAIDRRELASHAASSARSRFESDYGLAVLDCPDFDPDEGGKQSPVTYVALAGRLETIAARTELFGDPAIQKSRTVKAALNLLRLKLLGK